MLKNLIWSWRQSRRDFNFQRPVLDLVNFGTGPGVVLDVGANRGGFASQVLVRAPLMQVHCFEPNGELCGRLREQSVDWGHYRGTARAIINGKGVGSVAETKELIVTGLDAASSFLPVADMARSGWPTADFEEVRKESVEVIRLDEYLTENSIAEVNLLKLDVQGFEMEALKGCGDRLRDIRYIMSEVQFVPLYDGAPIWNELVAYAADFGFSPVVMDGFCFGPDRQPLQADVLLKRSDSAGLFDSCAI